MFYLERLGYKIVEFDGDYRVSLEKIDEKWIEKNPYEITINIYVTKPALFREKPALIAKI